jgi:predicted glycogen debranching enzyme
MDEEMTATPWETGPSRREQLLSREWLVTNGLGGYASGSVAGVATRRFHALLVAALPGPLGRVLMLNHLSESLRGQDGRTVFLGGEELAQRGLEMPGAGLLQDFRLEFGLPVWRYRCDSCVLEKRLVLPHLQNTVYVSYRLLSGDGPVRLKLRPSVHFRPHEAPVSLPLDGPYVVTAVDNRFTLACKATSELHRGQQATTAVMPPLRMLLDGDRTSFTLEGRVTPALLYRIEESLGYESVGDLWSPGHFRADLNPGVAATLVASTESWDVVDALKPAEAFAAELERRRRLILSAAPPHGGVEGTDDLAVGMVLAADQFLIEPAGRTEEAARAHAAGDDVRTVVAGYHWFTDWGRDTMISLEGLTLCTGRYDEGGALLRTFARHIREGLIPNLFPEGRKEGLYHTADATLWFFHALDRYLTYTEDRETLRLLLPKLTDVVQHHVRGTRFHIGVDPSDGLLRQGADGYQLTWMDAKVGDWVVTPRRGKAVEINALWYNALRLLEGWQREEQLPAEASRLAEWADKAQASFNRRFWRPDAGCLYDVVDGPNGDDAAFRPNQIFAISLRHPVLEQRCWASVVDQVREKLLTPVGLRSLSRDHPDYKSRYYGDLRARDAAYHQGTVWAWLIGPFLDAWLKAHPDDDSSATQFLDGFRRHLGEACLGTISEVFDAEPPFTPRGCVAQAWSVAELLRSLINLRRHQNSTKKS